jgi:hypothetical protein
LPGKEQSSESSLLRRKSGLQCCDSLVNAPGQLGVVLLDELDLGVKSFAVDVLDVLAQLAEPELVQELGVLVGISQGDRRYAGQEGRNDRVISRGHDEPRTGEQLHGVRQIAGNRSAPGGAAVTLMLAPKLALLIRESAAQGLRQGGQGVGVVLVRGEQPHVVSAVDEPPCEVTKVSLVARCDP